VQAKQTEYNSGVKDLNLTSMEAFKPNVTASAASIRHTNWAGLNIEMGAGCEDGQWIRLTVTEKNSLLAELEPFKLYNPNKRLLLGNKI